jgi:hypothetical protein
MQGSSGRKLSIATSLRHCPVALASGFNANPKRQVYRAGEADSQRPLSGNSLSGKSRTFRNQDHGFASDRGELQKRPGEILGFLSVAIESHRLSGPEIARAALSVNPGLDIHELELPLVPIAPPSVRPSPFVLPSPTRVVRLPRGGALQEPSSRLRPFCPVFIGSSPHSSRLWDLPRFSLCT